MSWWRRLFGDEKVASTAPGVGSIRFDSSGWKEKQASNQTAEWRNADGDVLRARFSARPAPYLSNATDLGALREHYRREAAASKGAIVSVETVSIQGIPCVEVIKKFERRPAYAYEGVLALGFDAYSYVLTIATVLRNMAFSWQKMGNEEKARELFQRAARVGHR